ncbi:MAG: hypothetical protein ACT4O1_14555 [Gemmatimonadota bacterium]
MWRDVSVTEFVRNFADLINGVAYRGDRLRLMRGKRVVAEVHPPSSAVVAAPRERVRLPTYGKGGLQPGVDLDNSAALLDLMEDFE